MIRKISSNNPVLCLRSIIFLLLFFVAANAGAQSNRLIQQGNKFYEKQQYKDAAAAYQKALAKDPTNTSGLFNLGNTMYQQKQFDSSRKVLASTEKIFKDKNVKGAANYNIGNSYMAQQKWEDAVGSFKQALRNNPNDVDAKYNLSYAEQMLKKQQEENKKQQKQNQDQKQDKKQNQDNKDKKDDKKDQDKQENKDKQDKDNKQQQQQSEPGSLTPQQAEQILNALQQQEKKVHDKLKKEKGTATRLEKDW